LISVVTVITRITFVTFYIRYIYIVRSLSFRIFSASFLTTFLSPEFASSVSFHVPFFIIRNYDIQFLVRDVSVSV